MVKLEERNQKNVQVKIFNQITLAFAREYSELFGYCGKHTLSSRSVAKQSL
jgi:hypothetical protein